MALALKASATRGRSGAIGKNNKMISVVFGVLILNLNFCFYYLDLVI
jgi:hypothetical protein